MKHEDDFIGNIKFIKRDKTRPPLRWIANALGSWAIYHLLKSVDALDNKNDRLFNFHSYIASKLLVPYNKWGTSYVSKEEDLD